MKRPRLTPSEKLKGQAERLEAFLEKGNHTLKHRVVLEAIAAIHNAPDWNTLLATANYREAGPEAWLVIDHRACGVDNYILCNNFLDGLRVFSAAAHQYACLLPGAPLSIGVDSVDAEATGLHLVVSKETILLSLRRPGQALFDDEGAPAFRAKPVEESLTELASELASALGWSATGSDKEKTSRAEVYAQSWTARYITEYAQRPPAKPEFRQLRVAEPSRVTQEGLTLFNSLSECDFMVQLTAVVQAGESEDSEEPDETGKDRAV